MQLDRLRADAAEHELHVRHTVTDDDHARAEARVKAPALLLLAPEVQLVAEGVELRMVDQRVGAVPLIARDGEAESGDRAALHGNGVDALDVDRKIGVSRGAETRPPETLRVDGDVASSTRRSCSLGPRVFARASAALVV